MLNIQETAIEHCYGDAHATVTAAEMWSKNLITKLAESHPDKVKIIYENKDGPILAHVPFKWVKISPPVKRKYTDEQRQAMRERMVALKGSQKSDK